MRDDVQLAGSDSLDQAVQVARDLVADGFTVWIFSVERSAGCSATYRMVERLDPHP